ncbi:MAG: SCP2 sterol-binding domain-containing protein [Pseudomonadota bacterium]
MSLQEVTENMAARVAERGGIAGKVVKFDFGDDGIVRIDASGAEAVVDNEDTDADCTIGVAMSDFIEIAAGEQNAQMAFMAGKLKVDGDMGIAMQLGTLLG